MEILANLGEFDNHLIRCQRLDTASSNCYSGSVTDTNLEKLADRDWTRRRSRIVDQRVQYLDSEGYTSSKCRGVAS